MAKDLTTTGLSETSQPTWRSSESDFDRIDYIFRKMESRFGVQWSEKFAGIKLIDVMNDWAEDLADLNDFEIAEGVAKSRDLRFPPSLGEFRSLCKSQLSETPENHPMYQHFTAQNTQQSEETQELVRQKIKLLKDSLRSGEDE